MGVLTILQNSIELITANWVASSLHVRPLSPCVAAAPMKPPEEVKLSWEDGEVLIERI